MKFEKEILHYLNGGEIAIYYKNLDRWFDFEGTRFNLKEIRDDVESGIIRLRIKPAPIYEYQWVAEKISNGSIVALIEGGFYLTEHEAQFYYGSQNLFIKPIENTKRERKQ